MPRSIRSDAVKPGRRNVRRAAGPWAVLILALSAGLAWRSPSVAAATDHADAPGIDWFAGDVSAAFDAARAANKPVFLYWGAKWCPPCQQLKSSVFSRSDFRDKAGQFVAVYLDGDDPGAQKWGERFHVLGYPTVVILRADRKEITRLSGGMDLSLYADLLDAALGDVKPISAVQATLRSNPGALTHGDCQRLAYYAWELNEYTDPQRRSLAAHLDAAARQCPQLTRAERARLTIGAATLAPKPPPALVAEVMDIVADPALGPRTADVLEGLEKNFFSEVRARGAQVSARFLGDWSSTLDRVANDPAVIDADRLAAVGMKLKLIKEWSTDGKIPDDAAADARARVAAALAKPSEPYVRAGVVNSASLVDEQLGDEDALYALLQGELKTAKAPYYYMADLAEIEEHRGHAEAALEWYERAYRESLGVATRFQWGSAYLNALLRLAPAERARIESVGVAVIGELDGPDRIQARTRLRLEKLDAHLRQWAAANGAHQALDALHARMQDICSKLPNDDAGRSSCQRFLSAA